MTCSCDHSLGGPWICPECRKEGLCFGKPDLAGARRIALVNVIDAARNVIDKSWPVSSVSTVQLQADRRHFDALRAALDALDALK